MSETKTFPPLREGERLDAINEHLRLIQPLGGLSFGTDAYLLAAFTRPSPAGALVDLGAGTGVVSLLCLTRERFAHAYAAELQPDYCDVIRRNAALNGLADRMTVLPGDVRALAAASLSAPPAAVVSNPPYLAAGAGLPCADPRMETARRELNGTIADFCAAAARLLPSGGCFYVVYRPERMAELFSALRAARLEPKRMVTVYPDAASRPCLILVEARRGGAPSLHQAPPLVIYQSGRERVYTSVMQRIYDTFSMEFLFETRKERRL